jgi:1-acyl-sn-glycerol-3-phosphate acyltransferase
MRLLMVKHTLKWAGKVIFRLRGWTFSPLPDGWQDKQVIIGFPHAAWADTAMAFSGFAIAGVKGHVIVKKEAFRWPFGWMLRKVGGISVDRSTSAGVVEQMVHEFQKRDHFQLALVPEGTRKRGAPIKTGFWHIAKGAGVPIVCWYLDAPRKQTHWLGRIEVSDDIHHDLIAIRRLYAVAGYEIEGISKS